MLVGVLFDRLNMELQMTVACLVLGLSTALATWTGHLSGFIAIMAVQGAAMGYIDGSGSAYEMELWHGTEYKAPLLQALHFVWSVGSTCGPLAIQPFLLVNEEENSTVTAQRDNVTPQFIPLNEVIYVRNTTVTREYERTYVQYGYTVIGGAILATALLFFIVLIVSGPTCINYEPAPVATDDMQKVRAKRWHRIFLLFLFFIFYALYVGIEGMLGNLIATYVYRGLGMAKYKGTLMTSVLWGALGIGRLIGAPVSTILSPTKLLMGNLLLVFSSCALLLWAGLAHLPEYVVWIAVVLLGLGESTVFATGILWISQHMPVTGFIGALSLVGSSTGAMALPALAGYFFQTYSHMWLVYIAITGNVIHILVFITMEIFATKIMKRERLEKEVDVPLTDSQLKSPTD